MPFPRLLLTALLASLMLVAPAHAADPVTQAMQSAYTPYRVALFRTNSQAQAESEQAMAQAVLAWRAIAQQFAAAPPGPYAQDAEFARTLGEVNSVLQKADEQVRARQLPQAHETLERVRDLLSELRQRNGVVVYSDHMNAYHEAMEHVLTKGPALATGPQGPMQLMAEVGTLNHLAERLGTQAPKALREHAEFAPAQQAVVASVQALRAALLAQDQAAVVKAIKALKPPYAKLFLKFG